MALKQSSRSNVPAFIVMEVMRAAAAREAEQKAVYHLEVGQPGTGAPRKVIEVAKQATTPTTTKFDQFYLLPTSHKTKRNFRETSAAEKEVLTRC